MQIKEVVVGPALAAKWLKRRINNRTAGVRTVSRYARAMKEGRWQVMPDCISFNRAGKLINGHVRLMAVIEANVPVHFMVATAVTDEPEIVRGDLCKSKKCS